MVTRYAVYAPDVASVMLLVVEMMVMVMGTMVSPAACITIPGHTREVLDALRRQLARHYYPTKAPHQPSQDLAESLCLAHSALALVSTQSWSNTMWDASGKVSDGVGVGGTEARGHPALCESVRAGLPGTLASHLYHQRAQLASLNLTLHTLHPQALLQENTTLVAKYCLVTVREDNEDGSDGGGGSWQAVRTLAGRYDHTYATCVPDTCTSLFLRESLQVQREEAGISLSVACHDDHTWTSTDLSFLLVTAALMATAAVATTREATNPCVATSCRCSRGARVLHCFSLRRNWSRLTATNTASTHLHALDGLRVVMLVWVILAHRYMLLLVSSANPRHITQHAWDWRYWWVFNAYPAVDTFFFISAFLVSSYLKKRLHQFTFSGFYFQRYLRLVPAMGYVTWGCSSVLRHLGSGPVWSRTYDAMFGRPCAHTAWTNMFLLNNFNDADHMCMGHLWSLAVEWQLYMVSPLLLLPAYHWPASRLRWLPLSACFTLSILLPAALTLQYDLPPTPTFWDYNATKMYYNMYYIVPWCRAGPYLVGVGAGCLYHWMDRHHVVLTPGCVRAWGWACVMVVVGVLVGPSCLAGRGAYWAALYSSLARPAWACALAFFVLNTYKGNPGVMAWLASLPVWAPLSRLSYSVFLVSLPLQTLITAAPHKLHYHHLTAVYLVVGDVVVSGVAGLLLVLLVEAPAASLLPLLASGRLWRGAVLTKTTTTAVTQENQLAEEPTETVVQDNQLAEEPTETVVQDNQLAEEPTETVVQENQLAEKPTETVVQENQLAEKPTETVVQENQLAEEPTETVMQENQLAEEPTETVIEENQLAEEPTDTVMQENQLAEEPTETVIEENQPAQEPTETVIEENQLAEEPTETVIKENQLAEEPTEMVIQENQLAEKPTETVIKEEQLAEEPTETVIEENQLAEEPTETVMQEEQLAEEPTETVVQENQLAEEPTETVVQENQLAEEPTETVMQEEQLAEEPTETVMQENQLAEKPTETVMQENQLAEKPTETVMQEDLLAEEATETVIQEEQLAQEPTETVMQEEQLAEEPTETVMQEEQLAEEPTETVIQENQLLSEEHEVASATHGLMMETLCRHYQTQKYLKFVP